MDGHFGVCEKINLANGNLKDNDISFSFCKKLQF